MTFLKFAGASALAIAISTGASAQTQTHGGAPGFGVLGFDGSAASLPARAGGALSLEGLSCFGYSTIEPSAAIDVGASGPLYIAAGSDIDLTLAVRGPDGEISCSDDDAGEFNPGVAFDAAAPGLYEVWIGTYGAGEGYPPVWLNVSADAFNTENPYIVSADPALPAAQTLRLAGGFRNDPQTLGVIAGGPAQMSGLDTSCYGRTSEAPAAALDYRGGALPLFISLGSESDTTIGVITPGGEVLCNDDAVNADAGVMIEAPEAGRYTIFAGLYDDRGSDGVPATLSISEIGYGGVDRRLDVAGEPVFGAHELAAGFMPDPASYAVEAGGAMNLAMAIGESAMGGGWCPGYATRTPTLRITYEGEGPLFISMESDTDTTLAVNGPDGAWICDDDSLGDLNPSLSYDAPRAGVYDIFAGTFSDGGTAPATIYVSEVAGGADPSTRMMDFALPALAATLSLEPGFAPDTGRIDVTAGGPAEPMNTGEAWCTGNYTNAPSVELSWAGGPFSLSTEGEGDTTLAVNLPSGDWICDDDGGEGLLSRLDLSGDAGVYDIWVGSFFSDGSEDAVLIIEDGR